MAINKAGRKIATLADWETYAGPKSPDQWVDGRSAKEVARAWLEGAGLDLPLDVADLLAKHPSFGPVESWLAEPEAKLPFDDFAGEPRNSDLVVHATDSHGPYLIAVEAKADEPFGETIAEALASALRRGYQRALLLIHEFVTAKTDDGRHEANAAALGTFVKRLSHGVTMEVRSGSIYGPFAAPGKPLFAGTTKLFIGKVTRDIRG